MAQTSDGQQLRGYETKRRIRMATGKRQRSMGSPEQTFWANQNLKDSVVYDIGARHTISSCRPRLFLEMHGETMNLERKNVGAILHVESGSAINVSNSDVAAEGHLYCVAAATAER